MINRWRMVNYLEDGVSGFQCLMCMNTWTAQTAPGYDHWETKRYARTWHYCPYCATHWDGRVQGWGEQSLGPRRERIEKAKMKVRVWKRVEPPFWWVIQTRTYWAERPADHVANRWCCVVKFPGLKYPVKAVLAYLRQEQSGLDNSDKSIRCEDQIRLVLCSPTDKRLVSCYEGHLHNFIEQSEQ